MARVLITGATGFIGRALLPQLQGQHEVFALARAPSAKDVRDGVVWIRQDLGEPLLESQLPQHIDAVVHLAQSKHYRQFPEHADDIFRVNVQSTQALLDYARRAGAKRFILASSGGVYGNSYERFVETDPVHPLNFYLSSKYAAELFVGNYNQYFHTVVFRFFFVFGPGQRGMLVSKLLDKVRNREPIRIEGNPGIRLNPIFVDDAVQVFQPALSAVESDLFNVAGDETVTLTELVHLCEEAVGTQAVLEYVPKPQNGDLVGANDRMKSLLGVSLRTSLLAGIKQIAAHRSALPACV